MLKIVPIQRVVLCDVHSEDVASSFDPQVVVDHLYMSQFSVPYLRDMGFDKVVAPDGGAVPRARKYAKLLGHQGDIVLCNKSRSGPGQVDRVDVIGEVKDKRLLVVDDMIDTAGTLRKVAQAVLEHGATSVSVCAAHGLFSNDALLGIEADGAIDQVIVTDSIFNSDESPCQRLKLTVLPMAPLLAEVIRRIETDGSVSSLIL
jgi:ribose-phosphate pyrophosphokinase